MQSPRSRPASGARPRLLALLALVACANPDPQEGPTRTYLEMREEVVDLYGQERFSEAAEILEAALDDYPDNLMANCVNLALMNVRMESLDGALDALAYGLDHGIWYGKYTFLDPIWEPMKEHVGWEAIEERIEEAKAVAAKQAGGGSQGKGGKKKERRPDASSSLATPSKTP